MSQIYGHVLILDMDALERNVQQYFIGRGKISFSSSARIQSAESLNGADFVLCFMDLPGDALNRLRAACEAAGKPGSYKYVTGTGSVREFLDRHLPKALPADAIFMIARELPEDSSLEFDPEPIVSMVLREFESIDEASVRHYLDEIREIRADDAEKRGKAKASTGSGVRPAAPSAAKDKAPDGSLVPLSTFISTEVAKMMEKGEEVTTAIMVERAKARGYVAPSINTVRGRTSAARQDWLRKRPVGKRTA
jgi:hypothetical protein